MADILNFKDGKGRVRLDPNSVLEEAKHKLIEVAVLGWTPDDTLYIYPSMPSASELLYLLKLSDRATIDKIYGYL